MEAYPIFRAHRRTERRSHCRFGLGYSREANSRCLLDIAQGDKQRRDAPGYRRMRVLSTPRRSADRLTRPTRATDRRNRSRGLGARETKAAPAQDIQNR
jgi:hypothetical protein